MEPAFQIVIVLYNSARWVSPCLEAIQRLNYANHQTWVVDNGSHDMGARIVARDYPWAHLVRSEFNLGFAGANNLGVDQSSDSEFILLLNPDTEIHPDCLRHLAEAFGAAPDLGVAGCKIYSRGGAQIQHVGAGIRPNGLPYHIGEGERERGQYTGLLPCAYVQGAAMAVRRDLWDELGGLDEGFHPAYFEEADFCARARRAGRQVAVACEATVIHFQDPREQVASAQFLELLFRGRARYLIKHYRARDWLLRYLPAELRWLASRDSKYLRRIALRTLWQVWTGTAEKR